MLRKFLATLILVISLHAATNEKFQVIANDVNTKDNILVATGNVVIFSPTYYITAQRVIYDKNKGTLELFDDVIILKDNNVQTKSDYAFLEINSKDSYQKPNMFFEESSSIWINSKDVEKKSDVVKSKKSILSSCDCIDPDWSIRASSVDYDTKNMWVDTYNTRFYFRDVPVFYTPYFGFSTNKTRRTGLLIPTIGYSKEEGFAYTQPIFIAPKPNYDIELIPQYRGDRGMGMYVYLRYADSIDSMLKISTGYFREKKDYQQEHDLRNREHYGLDIDYERYNIFTNRDSDIKDGLYLSINYLNDIEYKTLEDTSFDTSNEKNIESKINYIYDTPEYYFGSYFRYYINTQSEKNTNTLQELPKLQAHKYTRTLFDKLIYSSDFKYTNHFRENGIKANQYELSVPLSYSFSFFDDYLKLILKQETSFNRYEYLNEGPNKFNDGNYLETNSIVSLNTDLIKPYENYLHTINLNIDYTKSRSVVEDGDLYSITSEDSQLSDFPVSKTTDTITFGLNQSLYDREDLRQIINHKISQSVISDEFDDMQLQNLQNEITYNYILSAFDDKDITGTIKNKVTYNFQDEQFIESSSSLSFSYDKFYLNLGHYMSEDTPNSGKDNLESYNITARYKLSDKYSVSYYTNYNVVEDIRSKQSFIFSINEQCWSLDFRYDNDLESASTSDGSPKRNDVIYIQLFLKPIGGITQKL